MLETCLYFYTALMPSVTFHSAPLGTAKAHRPFRRHKHCLLQLPHGREGSGPGQVSSLGRDIPRKYLH